MGNDMNVYDPQNLTAPPEGLWDFSPILDDDAQALLRHSRFTGMGWRQDAVNGSTQTIRIFGEPSYAERHPNSCNDSALRAYRRFNAECKQRNMKDDDSAA